MNKLTEKDTNKLKTKLITIVGFIILFIVFINDYLNRRNKLELILLIIFILIIIYMIIITIRFVIKNSFSINKYNKYIEYTLKNFDNLIVETEYVPNLEDFTIIKVNELKELMDVYNIINEPILYTNIADKNESMFFIKNKNDLYLYLVKESDFKEEL